MGSTSHKSISANYCMFVVRITRTFLVWSKNGGIMYMIFVSFFCRLVACTKQPEALFILFSVLRAVSGSGAVLLNVSCTAILMQSKSYSNATLFVSLSFTLLSMFSFVSGHGQNIVYHIPMKSIYQAITENFVNTEPVFTCIRVVNYFGIIIDGVT